MGVFFRAVWVCLSEQCGCDCQSNVGVFLRAVWVCISERCGCVFQSSVGVFLTAMWMCLSEQWRGGGVEHKRFSTQKVDYLND